MSDDDAPGPSSRKRQRAGNEQRAYACGSVVRIVAHNFMTYEHVTVEPGPRLNLVLGPNGTGKSSLVCALCIGLAGNPRVLGRADSVKDFVRRGQTEGWVEITLSNGMGNRGLRTVRIKRLIRVDNSSKWFLNGSEATQTAVRETVGSFHVQLDNLCQFLPQDRVAAFAAMRPHELLEETEKAIGNAELFNHHQELKAMKQSLTGKQSELTTTTSELDTLRAQNQQSAREVQRAEERERLQQQAEHVRKKIEWTRWKNANTKLQQLEQELEQCKALLATRQQEEAKGRAPLARRTDEVSDLEERYQAAKRAFDKQQQGANTSVSILTRMMSDKINMLSHKLAELSSLERRDINHRIEVAEARLEVHRAREQLRALPPLRSDWQAEHDAADQQHRDYVTKQRLLASSYDEVNDSLMRADDKRKTLQERLATLLDVKALRLRNLETQKPGITRQYEWVCQHTGHEHGFRGKVLGPLALEVDVRSPLHAAMVEHICPRHIWNMFLVEHPEDQTLLISKMKVGLNDRPAVTYMDKEDAAAPIEHPGGPASQYAQWGITHTLDEVVLTDHAIVKHTLCNEGNIAKAYIGTSETEARMQELLSSFTIGTIFTPTQRHTFRTSYYNNTTSVQSDALPLRPRTLQGDRAAVEAERAELQQQLDACTKEVETIDAELRRIHKQQDDMAKLQQAAKKNLDRLEKEQKAYLAAKRNAEREVTVKLSDLRAVQQRPMPMGQKPALEAAVAQLREEVVDLVKRSSIALASLAKKLFEVTLVALELKERRTQLEARMGHLEEVRKAIDMLKKSLARIKKDRENELKNREAFESAQQMSEADIAAFEGLPNDIESLTTMQLDLQGRAAGIHASDHVLHMYRQRTRQIEELAAQQQAQQSTLDTLQASIAELQEQWLPELQRIVGIISSSFSESFRRVGCAGEVALVVPEDGDMSKFAIEIRVKFREEEALHTLNASRQSGGERSLSTILYLIALQGVTAVPFRVVDEINQGMDAVNERKAFEQLVETATQSNTPQCFLLTPKLLPNLEYSDDVTVLQIMNGPYVDEVANNFSMDMLFGTQAVEASA